MKYFIKLILGLSFLFASFNVGALERVGSSNSFPLENLKPEDSLKVEIVGLWNLFNMEDYMTKIREFPEAIAIKVTNTSHRKKELIINSGLVLIPESKEKGNLILINTTAYKRIEVNALETFVYHTRALFMELEGKFPSKQVNYRVGPLYQNFKKLKLKEFNTVFSSLTEPIHKEFANSWFKDTIEKRVGYKIDMDEKDCQEEANLVKRRDGRISKKNPCLIPRISLIGQYALWTQLYGLNENDLRKKGVSDIVISLLQDYFNNICLTTNEFHPAITGFVLEKKNKLKEDHLNMDTNNVDNETQDKLDNSDTFMFKKSIVYIAVAIIVILIIMLFYIINKQKLIN